MKQATKDRIMQLHNKHLSIYYIEKHLEEEIPQGIIQKTIEEELRKDINEMFR